MSNGEFTKIPNELLEALARTRIPGEARQMFDCLYRKIVGWNKSSDVISISQIREMTGLSNSAIFKARNKLRNMHMIRTTQLGRGLSISYEIITSYKTWKPLPKKVVVPNRVVGVPKKVVATTQKATTKERKETIQKKEKTYDQTLFDRWWNEYPRKVSKLASLKAWIRINPDETMTMMFIDAIKKQELSTRETQFIPHPSSWLNGKRWEDEPDGTNGAYKPDSRRHQVKPEPGKYDHLS